MTLRSVDQMTAPVHFDDYAQHYDDALNRGLAATGEAKDYFARGRIQWLSRCLQKLSEQPKRILDFGCGDGSTSEFFLAMDQESSVIGVDTSEKSLDLATRNYGTQRASFQSIE